METQTEQKKRKFLCRDCKRRKFNDDELDYLKRNPEHTCLRCDLRNHRKDILNQHYEQERNKHPTNLEQHKSYRITQMGIMEEERKEVLKE